jgi:hypothetical protein
MDAETWTHIESLLHSALEIPDDERRAFLQRVCDGDQSLEREVSSLLNSLRVAHGFLETPAIEEAVQALAAEEAHKTATRWSPSPGQAISHYRIVEKLGSGGMGSVYKAEDPRLHRFVALKFLSETLVGHHQALERFRREAAGRLRLEPPSHLHHLRYQRRCALGSFLIEPSPAVSFREHPELHQISGRAFLGTGTDTPY